MSAKALFLAEFSTIIMLAAIPFAGYACNCSPKREQSVQRDLDLFRDMLLQIERSPHSVHWYEIAIPGRSREQLAYHAKLAADAGLIEARFLWLAWLAVDARFDAFRGSEQYYSLLGRMGLPPQASAASQAAFT